MYDDTTPGSYKHETRLIHAFRPCPTQPDHKRDPDSCPICSLSIARHRTAFRTFGLHFRVISVYVIVLPHLPGTRAPISRRLKQAYSISPRTFPIKPICRYRRLLYMVVSLRRPSFCRFHHSPLFLLSPSSFFISSRVPPLSPRPCLSFSDSAMVFYSFSCIKT